MTIYSYKSNAVRAARKALGPEAREGVDFTLIEIVGLPTAGDVFWDWKATSTVVEAPAVPMPDPEPETRGARLAREARASIGAADRPSPAVRPVKSSRLASARVAAEAGTLPEPPVFTSKSALPYNRRLKPLVELVGRGDIKGLKAYPVDAASKDGRVAAMGKYRDLAVIALKAARREAP